MSPLEKLVLAWVDTCDRYVSTVCMGGTPAERRWAWDRANRALTAVVFYRSATVETAETPVVEGAP